MGAKRVDEDVRRKAGQRTELRPILVLKLRHERPYAIALECQKTQSLEVKVPPRQLRHAKQAILITANTTQ